MTTENGVLQGGPAGGNLKIKRPAGLVPTVVSTLTRRIVSGEFAHPVEFPPSADLVEQLGVSRTVIREALRVLESKQLISIKQGRNTLVLPSNEWDLLDPEVLAALTEGDVAPGVFKELIHVRAALEAEMARVAAEKFQPETPSEEQTSLERSFTELQEAYAALDGSPASTKIYLDRDRAFHNRVMDLSKNRFAKRIVHQVFVWARGGNYDVIRPTDLDAAHADHARIFASVRDGNADEAYQAMRSHILLHWAATTRERLEQQDQNL